MFGSRGGEGGTWGPDPPGKSQSYRFTLRNTAPNPLENHKASMPRLNVGPLLARQQNAIEKEAN